MKEFVDVLIKIMPDNKCKTRVKSLFCDGTYLFKYNMKTTKQGKFPDSGIFYDDSFQICISITVEVQLQSWNFKLKRAI